LTEVHRNKRAVGCQLESVCPCISVLIFKPGVVDVVNNFGR